MSAKHDTDDPEERLMGDHEGDAESEQQEAGVDAREAEEEEDEEEDDEEEDDDEEEEEDGEEEDEEEDDDEDDGEEDEEDEDGGWERMSTQRVVAHLKESAERNGNLSITWEGSTIVGSMGSFTEDDMDELLEAISQSVSSDASWDRLIRWVSIDLEDPYHTLEVAGRITDVLDCLNLSSLKRFDIVERPSFLDEPVEQPWKPFVVDHYVDWMTTTASITFPERMTFFFLECLGNDPEVWSPFVERFSCIESLELALRKGARRNPNASRHGEALALSARKLPKLRSLWIIVRATGLSSILSCFLRKIAPLPTLVKFNFIAYLSDLELDDVYKFLAFSTSLKEVLLDVDEDFTALYNLLAKNNVTLQSIAFRKEVRDADTKAKIEWLLTLNRYNRRCLLGTVPHPVEETVVRIPAEDTDAVPVVGQGDVPAMAALPAGAWPLVLGPISADNRADVMYHFLGKMPKSLLMLQQSPPPPGRGLKRAGPPSDRGPDE